MKKLTALIIISAILQIASIIYLITEVKDSQTENRQTHKSIERQLTELRPNGTHQDYVDLINELRGYKADIRQNTKLWESILFKRGE